MILPLGMEASGVLTQGRFFVWSQIVPPEYPTDTARKAPEALSGESERSFHDIRPGPESRRRGPVVGFRCPIKPL